VTASSVSCQHLTVVQFRPRLMPLVSATDEIEVTNATVTEYCHSCRSVLPPRAGNLRVSQSVRQDDQRYARMLAAVPASIGQPGPWDRLGLPSWSEVAERRDIERIQRRALFEDFDAHGAARLAELVRHHLRLTRGKSRRELRSPAPFTNVHVNVGSRPRAWCMNPAAS
jgi:hypothetical protein